MNTVPRSPWEIVIIALWKSGWRRALLLTIVMLVGLFYAFTSLTRWQVELIADVLIKKVWGKYGQTGISELYLRDFIVEGEEFESLLSDSATHAIEFIGLTDGYTLSNYADELTKALNRGAKIRFYLYLPGDTSELGEYITLMNTYRPHGDDVRQSLLYMWTNASAEFNAAGTSADFRSSQSYDGYSKYFYAMDPKGWLIIVNYNADADSFERLYWFPYLVGARSMQRPGFRIVGTSIVGAELIDWFGRVRTEARKADEETIRMWKLAITAHCAPGTLAKPPLPISPEPQK